MTGIEIGPGCRDYDCDHDSCYVEPGGGLLDHDPDVALGPLVHEPARHTCMDIDPRACAVCHGGAA